MYGVIITAFGAGLAAWGRKSGRAFASNLGIGFAVLGILLIGLSFFADTIVAIAS